MSRQLLINPELHARFKVAVSNLAMEKGDSITMKEVVEHLIKEWIKKPESPDSINTNGSVKPEETK